MKKLSPIEKRLLFVFVPCSVWAFVSMIALGTMERNSFAFIWFDLTLIAVCFVCLVWVRNQMKKYRDCYCRHIGTVCPYAGNCSSGKCPVLQKF